MNDLTIIIPCYNEEKSLQLFLPDLIEFSKKKKWKIFCVNDGSKDDTLTVLKQFNNSIFILNHKVNKGYGGAIKSGIKLADTEYCITIDADGQHCLSDIEKLYQSIVNNDGDMVVGSRIGNKSTNKFRSFGKWIIRNFAKIFMKLDIYDINSGMKIFRTEIAKRYLHICPDSMPYSDIMTLLFIHNRHLVYEEKIQINERIGGKSTIGVNTAFETIMEILNIAVLFNPMKLFMPLSIFFFVFGIVWGLYHFSLGHGVNVGSSLFIIMGVLIFLLGLIAEQLVGIRNNMK